MKDLVFQDQNKTVNVTFRTDLINATDDNFTVQQITGLTALDQSPLLGFAFKKLPYSLGAFKQFATTNDLSLTMIDQNTKTTLVAISNPYLGGGLGEDLI